MYDVVIVGAGPAGISVAVEAVEAGIPRENILILEKEKEHAFTIKKFYPEAKLVTANYKGMEPRCEGILCMTDLPKSEVVDFLDQTIARYQLPVHYEEQVYAIHEDPERKLFVVRTSRDSYETRIVVIAIGVLGRPNRPNYPIPSSLSERVFFDVTSHRIENQRVLVVGGGDSAAEYVQYLLQFHNTITMSYRRDSFERMNQINRRTIEELARLGMIEVRYNSNIRSLEDFKGKPLVHFVEPPTPVEYDAVVYALGGSSPKNFLESIGIAFDGVQPLVNENGETNVPGIFLVGDLIHFPRGGSIITAFNSARKAMEAICDKYLGCKVRSTD
ncbi:NAD(P)-binding domain-containing protein [Thermospira aquatica]|uniref:NAD(P)-binding domain-containing protein n=1 Tax=Thermospira aquatica TaxID=2828656 RepID=A0AAX3BFV2_9SPIR|nr:NAD(P)-binding domain-containing protein [Thermospira aquatica]URA11099.1 NAD(P)-binding domain-containing protein [Thermospira aquatica]